MPPDSFLIAVNPEAALASTNREESKEGKSKGYIIPFHHIIAGGAFSGLTFFAGNYIYSRIISVPKK